MDCAECKAAAANLWHVFMSDCRGCVARQASRSPAYAESRQAGRILPMYRGMLDRLGLDHADVKAAAEADVINRKAANEA